MTGIQLIAEPNEEPMDRRAVVVLIGLGKALGFASGFLIRFYVGLLTYRRFGATLFGEE